jgi:hypothetical protein
MAIDSPKSQAAGPQKIKENYIWLRWLSRILLVAAIPVPLILSVFTKEVSFSTALYSSLILLGVAGMAWFFPLTGGGCGLIVAVINYVLPYQHFLGRFPHYIQENLVFLLPLSIGAVFSLKYALFRKIRAYSIIHPEKTLRPRPWWYLASFILLIIPGIYWLALPGYALSPMYLSFGILLLALIAWGFPTIGGILSLLLSLYLFADALNSGSPAFPFVECFFLIIGGIVSIRLGITLIMERRKEIRIR